MKLYIYETEPVEDMPDDFKEATGCDYVVLNSRFSKAKKVTHSTPESLLAAIEYVEEQEGDNLLLIDSATDVCEHYRKAWCIKNNKSFKDVPWATIDARMWPVVQALKHSACHWIMTLQEKDDKLDKVTIGKKGKASGQLEYQGKIKLHCERIKAPKSVRVSISDQRGLKDVPKVVVEDPRVSDLDYLMERYKPGGHRVLRVQCYGRPEGGKSNTAFRLAIAFALQLGKSEGGA